ncbi:uncharacterized protein ISCGN_011315 [Ixodes scapularis]
MSRIYTIKRFPGAWNGEPVNIVSEQRWRRVRPCSSCGAVTKEIIALPCSDILCRGCHWELQTPGQASLCPRDGCAFTESQIQYLKTPVEDALELLVKCPNEKIGCGFVCALGTLYSHLSNSCDFKSTKEAALTACSSLCLRRFPPSCFHQPPTRQNKEIETTNLPKREPKLTTKDKAEQVIRMQKTLGCVEPRSANVPIDSSSLDASDPAKEKVWKNYYLHPISSQHYCYAIPYDTRTPQGPRPPTSLRPQQEERQYDARCPTCHTCIATTLQFLDRMSATAPDPLEVIRTFAEVFVNYPRQRSHGDRGSGLPTAM